MQYVWYTGHYYPKTIEGPVLKRRMLLLSFVLNNQINLHAACYRSRERQTKQRRRGDVESVVFLLPPSLFAFIFSEDAVEISDIYIYI